MTSSGHTGEHAIHSSDFSAFTKRPHRPSLLRFLTHLLPLRLSICTSATASVELCFSSRWSAMEFRRCIPPCARFIAREDPHSKCILCLGFSHAREAVYGTSNCKICDDFRLITLRSRLEDYERESSKFSRRASSTSAPPREIAAPREAAASRRAVSWGSDVELEEMESEQTGLAFSLPPSSERARANSPVEFLPDFQFPSPKARDFVSFGLDDILHTAASDSEDFGPALADALPPSGQEARPSAAYSELVDVLSRATEKLALDWPDEPRESRASKLDDRFLIGAHSKLERRKLPFFSDLHREISSSWKQPFSSRLTNVAAADFTNLVGSGRVTLPCRWLRILWPHIFHLLWLLLGSPAPSFLPSRVGPLPPLSGSPTSRPVRQVWPFTQWPSFRPTRRTSWRKWTKGPAWPWSREGATKSHWLGSESHQAHRTCCGALYGGFGGRRTPSVAQPDRDSGEGKDVFKRWRKVHFSLRHPEQGRRGLSFTVEGAAASRLSRHPISGMSSLARHSDPSVTLPSRMGAFTRGIAVGSPHNSYRLHSSVWEKSPPFRRGSPDSSKQHLQGFCSTTGTFLYSDLINCLELRAVFLALKYFLPVLGGHHVIVRTDNMAVVSHINRQGGSKSRTLDRLARHLLLWSQDKFLSLRAVHVPGVLNLVDDFLSRQKLKPGEWMLNRQTVSQIWDLFGKAEVDLFASQESSQCPLWFSLSFPTTLGIDAFAHPWPNVSLYAFPPIKLIPAVLCRVKVSGARLLLIAPFWPSQTWFSELTPLLYRPPWEIPIRRNLLSQLQGKIWHPQPELWKLWVWPIQGQGLWLMVCLPKFRKP